jgi:hypothetical protein
MNFFIKTLIILLSALTYNSYSFSINVNKHYSHVAGNILNINKYLKRSYPEHLFKSITYYNNNKSICYTFDSKNKVKYLMKDKYNYLISFDIFKYKYLIKIKSTPINYNSTFLDIDIRLNKNVYHNFTKLSYKHNKKINNIIYSYIYKNIIINSNKNETLSVPLFKFFNNF